MNSCIGILFCTDSTRILWCRSSAIFTVRVIFGFGVALIELKLTTQSRQCQYGKVLKKKRAIAIPQIKTLEEADAHQRKHGFAPLITAREKQLDQVHGEVDLRNFVERGQNAQRAVDAEIKKATKLRGEKRKINQTEREFEVLLKARMSRGEIVEYRFEGVRLGWGDCMVYKPDFTARRPDGRIELLEVKGAHIRDRDIVRFKGCRAEWKDFFIFEMHQKKDHQWSRIL